MTTIKDVAEACRVSIATASRALSGQGYVKETKRQLILKKASELGYIVDANAKSLKKGRSNTIGIIVSDVGNYFYNLVLEKLIVEFKKLGYNVLISYSFENHTYERENIKSMLSSKVDALLFTPVSNGNADLINLMKQRDIKILQLFRQAYPTVDALCVDDEYGAYLATKDLLSEGYRKILLLSVKLDFTPNRSSGYLRAFKEKRMPIDEQYIHLFPLGNSIELQVTKLIDTLHPDAILAGTNNFGMDALMALKKMNRSIPLVVFDDLEWFQLLNVSTVAQPIDEIFHGIIDNIMQQINGTIDGKGTVVSVRPHLVRRYAILHEMIKNG